LVLGSSVFGWQPLNNPTSVFFGLFLTFCGHSVLTRFWPGTVPSSWGELVGGILRLPLTETVLCNSSCLRKPAPPGSLVGLDQWSPVPGNWPKPRPSVFFWVFSCPGGRLFTDQACVPVQTEGVLPIFFIFPPFSNTLVFIRRWMPLYLSSFRGSFFTPGRG